MAVAWPAQLQQFINEDSFDYGIGDTVIQSQPDSGPPKRRRRFSKGIDTLGVTINLAYDDFSILKAFYETTTNGGVDAFEYVHPITQTTEEFKFIGPPKLSRLGGTWFRVSMRWELQN